jgi:NAD-dependent DNA ligase
MKPVAKELIERFGSFKNVLDAPLDEVQQVSGVGPAGAVLLQAVKQAVEKGDIRFYEQAYLEARVSLDGRKAVVELADFVIPNDDLIPPEVREKIKKWSDYVDYWAVDWDFRDDTFVKRHVADIRPGSRGVECWRDSRAIIVTVYEPDPGRWIDLRRRIAP